MNNTSSRSAVLIFLAAAFYLFPFRSSAQSDEQAVVDHAWELLDNEDYQACLKELEALPFEKGEPGAEAYYLLGVCQYELGDYPRAIESFGTSLKKDPGMTENYTDRGYAYWANSQYREAAADFQISLNKHKRKKDRTFAKQLAANYAYCLGLSGEHEKALAYLEGYRKKDADLLHLFAYFTSEFGNDPEKAIVYWEQALQADPKHKDALVDLSITYSEVDDYNMAFYHIEKLIENYPDYGKGYYLKGVYLEETGEDGDAVQYFEKAKELGYDPEADE